MNKNTAIIGLMFVTIIWGGGFVATDIALEYFTPFQIMTIRFFIAFAIFGLISIKDLKKSNKKEILSGIILGVALFLGFAFQTIGLKYTTPSKNAFLTATNVVFVPFIAYFLLKKKISKNGLIGAVIATLGIAFLSLEKDFTIGYGDTLSLICALSFAFQIFLTSQYAIKYNTSVLNTMQMFTSFILSFIFLFFKQEHNVDLSQINQSSILGILYLGLGSTTICYLLQTNCQRYVDETKSAIILSMESLFGTIFSILILHEELSLKMIIGCFLILSAVILSNLDEIKSSSLNLKEEVQPPIT